MTKILIVGIGGVGGYFGGLLAHAYHGSQDLSICFMARGENLYTIKQNGLLVSNGNTEMRAFPGIISDDPVDFGEADFIVICTKSYDIKETAQKIESCIGERTVLLPLLNGISSTEELRNMYPNNLVANGCAYIISRLIEPGYIQTKGNDHSIIFGMDTVDSRLELLYDIFKQANVDATLTQDIIAKIWEKFIFISTTATVTSYYNKTFGEIKNSPECRRSLKKLIEECYAVAECKKIMLPKDVKERVWDKFIGLPSETTTSMHSDFLSGKRNTEVYSLTGYLIEEARKYSLALPKYQEMYAKLSNSQNFEN